MRSRLELQKMLEELLGTRNVYFQPPETLKMQYPCIRYKLSDVLVSHAEDVPYLMDKAYEMIYIDSSPDNEMFEKLASLPKCRFNRHYVADGLNCYVYKIYY